MAHEFIFINSPFQFIFLSKGVMENGCGKRGEISFRLGFLGKDKSIYKKYIYHSNYQIFSQPL
jgi:hypothetical protein